MHAYAEGGVESVGRFRVAQRAKLGSDLRVVEHPKATTRVKGAVPRDRREGGEGHSREMPVAGPLADVVQQGRTETPPTAFGPDAELFKVRQTVDDVDERVTDRHTIFEDHPGTIVSYICGESLNGLGLVPGDFIEADLREEFSCGTLDLS